MSLQSFIEASTPELDALRRYTDELHAKYGGQVGCDMDDSTWAKTTADETIEYRRLERLANAEHERLKALHRAA
jgi:hypothetical protein